MHVLDALPPISAHIEDEAIAALREPFRRSDLPCSPEQRPKQVALLYPKLGEVSHVLIRNDQHMARSLRRYIAEGRHRRILIDDIGSDLTAYDATENTT